MFLRGFFRNGEILRHDRAGECWLLQNTATERVGYGCVISPSRPELTETHFNVFTSDESVAPESMIFLAAGNEACRGAEKVLVNLEESVRKRALRRQPALS